MLPPEPKQAARPCVDDEQLLRSHLSLEVQATSPVGWQAASGVSLEAELPPTPTQGNQETY